jgi:hypothetical protein
MTTDHCDGCPFRGCESCEYQGGTDPNQLVPQRETATTDRGMKRANGGVVWEDENGPRSPLLTQRRVVRGPSPTEAAKPHDWTYLR